jgi:hypothetical protein
MTERQDDDKGFVNWLSRRTRRQRVTGDNSIGKVTYGVKGAKRLKNKEARRLTLRDTVVYTYFPTINTTTELQIVMVDHLDRHARHLR